MTLWFQTRRYTCPRCGERYLHDRGHHHAVFTCPARPMPKMPAAPFVGQVYVRMSGGAER